MSLLGVSLTCPEFVEAVELSNGEVIGATYGQTRLASHRYRSNWRSVCLSVKKIESTRFNLISRSRFLLKYRTMPIAGH
jgi:hypothetical protein